MKCINNRMRFLVTILCMVMILCGCGNVSYSVPYARNSETSSFNIVEHQDNAQTFETFASDLCIVSTDKNNTSMDFPENSAVALFDVGNSETLIAQNANITLHPASLTKIMTAMVALKHATSDQMLTASENVKIQEADAQVCGIAEGDKMTLDQALHILLVYSANDAAIMIAENVAGSVDNFCALMNEEALALGATNSHFANPHGLTQDEHYVTAYDMYLIFNEAIKNPLITEIIQMSSYSTVYYDKNGTEKAVEVDSTNRFINGKAEVPTGIRVLGGKTGTTNAAGHCLVLYAKDNAGNPYISIIMNEPSTDELYDQMKELLIKASH